MDRAWLRRWSDARAFGVELLKRFGLARLWQPQPFQASGRVFVRVLNAVAGRVPQHGLATDARVEENAARPRRCRAHGRRAATARALIHAAAVFAAAAAALSF
eukprot:5841254-Pleurochrysis_carterae.AAC.1